jgi:hypothetical protein
MQVALVEGKVELIMLGGNMVKYLKNIAILKMNILVDFLLLIFVQLRKNMEKMIMILII